MSNDEKKYEYVSALMDDELTEADLALMLEDKNGASIMLFATICSMLN